KNRVYAVQTFDATAVGPILLLHTNGQDLKVLSAMKPIFQGTDMKYTVRSIIMIQKALLISAAV
ncbi:hypothetical protein NMB9615945_2053, partial [Neisseria meningitidis 961-5945]